MFASSFACLDLIVCRNEFIVDQLMTKYCVNTISIMQNCPRHDWRHKKSQKEVTATRNMEQRNSLKTYHIAANALYREVYLSFNHEYSALSTTNATSVSCETPPNIYVKNHGRKKMPPISSPESVQWSRTAPLCNQILATIYKEILRRLKREDLF